MKTLLFYPGFKRLLIAIPLSFAGFQALAQPIYCDPSEPGFIECEFITCAICNLDGHSGSTAGYGDDPDNDLAPLFCGTVQSVQYLKFYAAVPNMAITVTTSNCTVNSGIDLGLMTICDFPLSACAPGNGSNSTTLSLSSLAIGGVYILVIDVDAAGDCNFDISVNPPTGATPDFPPNMGLQGDFTVCPNGLGTYQVDPTFFEFNYDWTIPPIRGTRWEAS